MQTITMSKNRGLFRKENLPLLAAAAFLAFVVLAGPAFAGTDTTFDTAFTKFTAFLEGSGGKIITIISLALGLVGMASGRRSEEHTSELQSLMRISYAVFCLKKNTKKTHNTNRYQ